jgi:hypothetical protein
VYVDGEHSKSDAWNSNRNQFARLLAEIHAVGLTDSQLAELGERMELPRARILEVIERADQAWEFERSDATGPDFEPKEYELYVRSPARIARVLRVTAVFCSEQRANAYLSEHPGQGVIATIGPWIVLANLADDGAELRRS